MLVACLFFALLTIIVKQ